MADVRTVPQVREALVYRGLDASGLEPVGVRPPLGAYLRDLWRRRHFIWLDSRYRVATQHSGTRLGSLWLVLRPLLDAALYFVIFGVILNVTRGVDNFAAYVTIGVLMFRSTSRTLSQAPNTFRSGRAMIKAFSFPRISLPIAAELRDAMQMAYTVAVMLVLIIAIPPHETPSLVWFMVLPVFAMQVILNVGISFVLARIGFLIPDIAQLMSVVSRFLMYGSGVIFPIDNYLDDPLIGAIVRANPIYQMLHMYRGVLMAGAIPSGASWSILVTWALGLFAVGFVFFWRGEASYGADH